METVQHWADQTAVKIIKSRPERDVYTLASGITPSGTVHIGNFREIITVDLVARALKKLGKKVRFIFSWDDYDVLRKIPKNLPDPKAYEINLTRPICSIPDPWGNEKSYARHFEKEIENILPRAGIFPEFIYQAERYQKSIYAESIHHALVNSGKIAAILDKYRTDPLEENWMPVSIFCEKCLSNSVKIKPYCADYKLTYSCLACKHENTVDLRSTGCVKLLWRVDWPMRWAYEKVDFEPGGKDHSSDGGSYDTARLISREIFNHEPPVYLMYDFVRIKGRGGKISSSSGEVITLADVLEIYEPEIARFIFASCRPNTEFAVSFDLDVVKIYEDYDRTERDYFGTGEASEAKRVKTKAGYEYSQTAEPPAVLPFQASFRHLSSILQIHNFNYEKTMNWFEKDLAESPGREKFITRMKCVHNWIEKYAPDEFKFIVNEKTPACEPDAVMKKAISELVSILEKNFSTYTDQSLYEEIYNIINRNSLDPKIFFKTIYQILISKDNGPRLSGFLLQIGQKKALALLTPACHA
ncbi:MAG: lysine--tRNA ligase [Spirochaetes bacterium GWF1_41_5]|nr:MAG: lysine--tRNA ligase [Spirochaetes bacterium GWF1_41_5]HBE02661.1 lysine--tRNA ligase [Spirochaetia bacterium]